MATWSKSQLADRVLENIGVKPSGQDAQSDDSNRTQEIIDAVHDELRAEGLAPFSTSAVPKWAQVPMRDIVSEDVANLFGVSGERLQALMVAAQKGRIRLAKQTEGQRQPVRTKTLFY